MILSPADSGSVHLDFVRGLSAVVVLGSHVRILYLVDYTTVEVSGPVTAAVYFATGFFHQAVLAFFVLSGFFIASSVARQMDSWSWHAYATDRATRLYVVLLPALAVTALCDAIGLTWANDPTPYFDRRSANEDFYRPVDAHDGTTMLANLAFLQTVVSPPFGSNSALWSLCNEFWYYIIFPLALLSVTGRRRLPTRLSYLALATGLLVLLPPVRPLFPVWLFGAAVRWIPPVPRLRSRWALPIASTCAAGATIGSRMAAESLLWDYAVGLCFAGWMYVLLHWRSEAKSGPYRRVSHAIAGCSFTLYAVHLPLLTLVAGLMGYGRSQPSSAAFAWLSALGIGVFAFAWLLAQLTERHTDRVRRWVLRTKQSTTRPYPAKS